MTKSVRNRMALTGLLLGTLCGVASAGSSGEDHESNAHASAHKHHMGLFVGATSTSGGKHGPTIGADYGYRLHKLVSLGFSVDYAADEIDATIIAAGVFLHPTDRIRLLVAPGVDLHDGHSEVVLRLGVLYDFHVGDWTLSPTAHLDALDAKENVIYGLGVGYGF